jgi:hypothetical protein
MKPEESWNEFERQLVDELKHGEADHLVVTVRRTRGVPTSDEDLTRYYVQFAVTDDEGLWVEAASNTFLDEGERLGPEAMAALDRLGWHPPSGDAGREEPIGEHSPNHFRHYRAPVSVEVITEAVHLACRTLHEVYGAETPAFLHYIPAGERDLVPLDTGDVGTS